MPYAVFGDPQSLNLYTYVENAPLNRIDADGHLVGNDCSYACYARAEENKTDANKKTAESGQSSTKGVYVEHSYRNGNCCKGETKVGFIEGTATHSSGSGAVSGELGVKAGGVDNTQTTKSGNSKAEEQVFTGEAKVGGSASLPKLEVKVNASAEAAVIRADASTSFQISKLKVTLSVDGTAISIGAHGELKASPTGFVVGAGLSSLFGAGGKIGVDWGP